MKTIKIFVNGKYEPVEVAISAHPTPCPHLFAHKDWKTYKLTHVPSGRFIIEHIPTLKEAKEWARRMGEVADFTSPLDSLKSNTALMNLLREYRRSQYQR